MSRTIKPMKTKYQDIWMKSKSEARFAEWCDKHEVKWIYEPDGYNVDGHIYVPDFYLPEPKCFIEIKPFEIDHEIEKMYPLIDQLSMLNTNFVVANMENNKPNPLLFWEDHDAPGWADHEITDEELQLFKKYKRSQGPCLCDSPEYEEHGGICWCTYCGALNIRNFHGSWHCRNCRHYIGNATLGEYYTPKEEVNNWNLKHDFKKQPKPQATIESAIKYIAEQMRWEGKSQDS